MLLQFSFFFGFGFLLYIYIYIYIGSGFLFSFWFMIFVYFFLSYSFFWFKISLIFLYTFCCLVSSSYLLFSYFLFSSEFSRCLSFTCSVFLAKEFPDISFFNTASLTLDLYNIFIAPCIFFYGSWLSVHFNFTNCTWK